MWWLLCFQQQWCGDEENLFSIQSLVPAERKHQPELGEKLQAMMFQAAVEVAIIGCMPRNIQESCRERCSPRRNQEISNPLEGLSVFESRTLLCRLIAHRIWIVFLSLYKTYEKERINKEDSVVRMTTPKSNLVMQLVCLCCGLFLSMVEPSVRPELSDQPIPFPCGGAMGVPVSSLSDVVVNLLKYMTSDRESR